MSGWEIWQRNSINFDEVQDVQKLSYKTDSSHFKDDLETATEHNLWIIIVYKIGGAPTRWRETRCQLTSWPKTSSFEIVPFLSPTLNNVKCEAENQPWHEQTKPKHSSMQYTVRSKKSPMEK